MTESKRPLIGGIGDQGEGVDEEIDSRIRVHGMGIVEFIASPYRIIIGHLKRKERTNTGLTGRLRMEGGHWRRSKLELEHVSVHEKKGKVRKRTWVVPHPGTWVW